MGCMSKCVHVVGSVLYRGLSIIGPARHPEMGHMPGNVKLPDYIDSGEQTLL
jgi:hypothetical protein